jgi:hypothetical protein
MLKNIGMAVALVLAGTVAGALPAMAQANCTAPAAPGAVDGGTATKDQLLAGITAVKAFIAASDTYQQCLGDDLKVQKDAATAAKKPLDPAIEQGVMTKVSTNQAQKEKAGAETNAAVGAYKKLHPNG